MINHSITNNIIFFIMKYQLILREYFSFFSNNKLNHQVYTLLSQKAIHAQYIPYIFIHQKYIKLILALLLILVLNCYYSPDEDLYVSPLLCFFLFFFVELGRELLTETFEIIFLTEYKLFILLFLLNK